MKSKLLAIMLTIIMVVTAVMLGACAAPKPAGPIELVLLSGFAPGWPDRDLILEPLVKRVNERAAGELHIKIIGPDVWPAFNQMPALTDRSVDLLWTTPGYHEDYVAGASAVNLVVGSAAERRAAGIVDVHDKQYRKRANATYLGEFPTNIPLHIYTNKRVDTLADFDGMKIRSAYVADVLIESLGASPMVIVVPEIYTAVERGTVDGIWFPGFPFTVMKWNEVLKYIIFPGMGETFYIIVANVDSWNDLPKDLQKLVIEVIREVEVEVREEGLKRYEAEVAKMLELGMEKITLPPAEAKTYIEDYYFEQTFEKRFIEKDPEFGPQLKEAYSKLK